MKPFNCQFLGDYPEEFDFCVAECPVVERCMGLQDEQIPFEAFRVVSEQYRRTKPQRLWRKRVEHELTRR